MKSVGLWVLALIVFLLGSYLSLSTGASDSTDLQIFWLLRVPRTIEAIAVGGGLAVAGVLIQAGLSNPLADPFTTGIASSAALGAVVGTMFDFLSRGSFFLVPSVFAFGFSLMSLALLVGWLRHRFRYATEVLLAGVVMGFFSSSLATLFLIFSEPATWFSALGWLLGALKLLSPIAALFALSCVLGCVVLAWFHWKALDLISVGEVSAEAVGVDVEKIRLRIFVLVAFITAVCVSVSGVIGFVGLIVPHVLRAFGVNNHRRLIPLGFLVGAGFLCGSDSIARTILPSTEIPVGVVMSLIGAPVFLFLARRQGLTYGT